MPNVMAALPNIGSSQCRKVWLTPTTRVPCSNAAKTRNPLKFAGVPCKKGKISSYCAFLVNKDVYKLPNRSQPLAEVRHIVRTSGEDVAV